MTPQTTPAFLLGVIEGFYGRAWPQADRHANARFCRAAGFNAYIYAPKSDACLRKQWDRPWDRVVFDELAATARAVREAGLYFGIGLSPWGLTGQMDANCRSRLREKLAAMDQLAPDILCILFDDMPGDRESLAMEQLAICEFLTGASRATRFVVCPTYYSFDPVLERVFGARPGGYWEQLGAGLDPRVDIFWTGDKVCSVTYPESGLDEIAGLFQRRPLLWDNYPVNDSSRASRHLYLAPAERPASLRNHVAGVVANPMNQAWLSRPALAGLAEALGGRGTDAHSAIARCFPPALATLLQRDQGLFASVGLDGIDETLRVALLADYDRVNHPASREVCDWLQGHYTFDPACLTD